MKRILISTLALVGVVSGAAAEDWTGFRLGGSVGLTGLETPNFTPDFAAPDPDDGQGYGIFVGYDRDLGAVVVGGELEWTGTDAATVVPAIAAEGIARAKVRIGYDAGRFMPYATVGATALSATGLDDATGLAYGLGGDFAVSDRVTVGLEMLFDEVKDSGGLRVDARTLSLRIGWRL